MDLAILCIRDLYWRPLKNKLYFAQKDKKTDHKTESWVECPRNNDGLKNMPSRVPLIVPVSNRSGSNLTILMPIWPGALNGKHPIEILQKGLRGKNAQFTRCFNFLTLWFLSLFGHKRTSSLNFFIPWFISYSVCIDSCINQEFGCWHWTSFLVMISASGQHLNMTYVTQYYVTYVKKSQFLAPSIQKIRDWGFSRQVTQHFWASITQPTWKDEEFEG